MTKQDQISQTLLKELPALLQSGQYALPTEYALCERFHVSRQTVRAALSHLEKEGYLKRRQGSGSFLTGLLPDEKDNHIALLLATDEAYIYPKIVKELLAQFVKSGYQVSLYLTNDSVQTEREILLKLLESPPRGILVEGTKNGLPNPNLDLYLKLKKQCSIVFLHGLYPNFSDFVCVKDDNSGGAKLLTHYLTQKKHKKIAGIFEADTMQGQERYLGFVRELLENGLPVCEDCIFWFRYEELRVIEEQRHTDFFTKLQKKLSSCSAVVCYNDEIAYGLMQSLQASTLRVPEDLSIASFDGSYLHNLGSLSITTLSHEKASVSETAAHVLTELLRGVSVSSKELSWQLVEGDSVMDSSF